MGNMGWAGAARTMIRSLDKKQSLDRKRRCSTMPWSYLIMGTCAPSRPLLGAPPQPRFLCSVLLRMMSLVAAMHLWELCIEVRGDSWGGRATQSAVGGDAIVVVGGGGRRGGARRVSVLRTVKHANYKRWGWDRSSDVRMLFEGDLARPCHPLCVETENKLGDCVLKIRCRICRSLISYHNSSWTYVATHIRSHNIATAQDIVAATALASESEANGEAFPIHKLPTPPPVKKEAAGDYPHVTHIRCPVLRD